MQKTNINENIDTKNDFVKTLMNNKNKFFLKILNL